MTMTMTAVTGAIVVAGLIRLENIQEKRIVVSSSSVIPPLVTF